MVLFLPLYPSLSFILSSPFPSLPTFPRLFFHYQFHPAFSLCWQACYLCFTSPVVEVGLLFPFPLLSCIAFLHYSSTAAKKKKSSTAATIYPLILISLNCLYRPRLFLAPTLPWDVVFGGAARCPSRFGRAQHPQLTQGGLSR